MRRNVCFGLRRFFLLKQLPVGILLPLGGEGGILR